MCICFYTRSHHKYSLILATNRDEFLSRPTEPAHWHPNSDTLSGIDVLAGGTWFGVERRTGKFGLLTNVREEASVRTRSRGKLVTDWLESSTETTIQDHIEALDREKQNYAGFNLLVGQISMDGKVEVASISNRSESQDLEAVLPEDESLHDVGVISNGALIVGKQVAAALDVQDKAWPKMGIGKRAFEKVVSEHKDEAREDSLVDELFKVLCLSHPALRDKEDVRSSVLVTPFDMFAAVPSHSATAFNGDGQVPAWYATRAQTVMLVERQTGRVRFVEKQAYEVRDGKAVWSGETREWQFQVGEMPA